MKKMPLLLVICFTVMLLLCSCNNADPKISSNGSFELLEFVESNNKSVVFAVRDCDGDYESIIFFSSRYSYFFKTDVYWAEKGNDFFVLSHDVGVEPYIFVNDTWESGYYLEVEKTEQNDYSVKLINISDDSSVEYSIDNIPKDIFNYIIEAYIRCH